MGRKAQPDAKTPDVPCTSSVATAPTPGAAPPHERAARDPAQRVHRERPEASDRGGPLPDARPDGQGPRKLLFYRIIILQAMIAAREPD